jgi:hypothetical protein
MCAPAHGADQDHSQHQVVTVPAATLMQVIEAAGHVPKTTTV